MPFDTRVTQPRSDIADVFGDNAQNILQKAAVSNMIGVLEQLNKISVFASEVFSDILTTTESTDKRIKNVKQRLSTIGSRVEKTESMFLENAPSYFYDNPFTGKEWVRKDPLRGLIFRRDRASKYVNRRRNEALPLPDLSDLDKISVSGPCVKKYSDSNFFMNEWLEAEKKKMEEEKAKRREKKKKRKKRKRQGAEKITGISKYVYDPITGKKVLKEGGAIAVTKYQLSNSNKGDLNFASSDGFKQGRSETVIQNAPERSAVAGLAQKQKAEKQQKRRSPQKNKSQKQAPSHQPGIGGPVPPPVPGSNAVPPPVPGINGGGNGPPPPVPIQQVTQPPKKLTAQEMAERSRAAMEQKMQSEAQSSGPSMKAGPPKMNALMASIRGGAELKKATVVKRKPRMDKRDNLMAALRKGGGGLKKVAESEKNVKKEEEKDATIFAILNRRKFMADDSDTETGSDWSSED